MAGTGIISLLLIIANVIISYRGFNDSFFYSRYNFEIEKITIYKDYKRLVTGGFLHVSWMHLLFNMLGLFFFSEGIEATLGSLQYLLIYFSSLIAGNLFALLVHRNQSDYGAVGASGAVMGVIFASIAIAPNERIGFLLIPYFSLPAWIYGLAYVIYTIYGIRSRKDNIGHDAHLAGALCGMLIAILMAPSLLVYNYVPILLIAVPGLVFIYIIITRPHALLIDSYFFKKHYKETTIDQRYNLEKADRQKEVDMILEKIHRKGIKSLSAREKKILDEYSKSER